MRADLDVGIEALDRIERGAGLVASDVGGPVQDLSVQIAHVDDVAVDDADRAYACGREIERHG